MTHCQLCFGLGKGDATKEWDRPLLETSNFFVIPSIGAMVQGWLLIVPKKHYICMGSLSGELMGELLHLKMRIAEGVKRNFGDFVIFEHGPARQHRKVGCSVDHAHIHIVPGNFDLIAGASKYLSNDAIWANSKLSDTSHPFLAGKDYLYVENSRGEGCICTANELGSQIFRKVIADCIGRPDVYNWRENPFLENALVTIKKFKSYTHCDIGDSFELKAC